MRLGVPDIRTLVPFDGMGFFSKVETQLPSEYYAGQVAGYLKAQYSSGMLPAYSVADVSQRGPILAVIRHQAAHNPGIHRPVFDGVWRRPSRERNTW